MIKPKQNFFLVITIGVISVLVVPFIINWYKEKKFIAGLSETTAIAYQYKQQLLKDSELRQQVETFSSPQNIPELFQKHKAQLQSFIDQCYVDRKESNIVFVEYINDNPFYFSTADTIQGNIVIEEDRAIKEGNHDDIVTFMDHAIDNKLVFRDWMLKITIPYPVDEEVTMWKQSSHQSLLFITIYDDLDFKIDLIYSPYEDVDYSDEYFSVAVEGNPGGVKIVRLDSHWYYQYMVTEQSKTWWPDPKTLGFSTIKY